MPRVNIRCGWISANQVWLQYGINGWRLRNLVIDGLVKVLTDHASHPSRLYCVHDIKIYWETMNHESNGARKRSKVKA